MYRKISLYLSLLGLGIVAGVFLSPLISGDNIFDQLEKYKVVFNTAFKNYVDEVSASTLTESAIKGMLSDLDPHSTYINAEEMQRVDEDMRGSFEGIGVQFDIISDTITVISPIAGGPSEAVGILAGDKIVKIDGVSAIGMRQEDVPKKLRGPKGTKVELEIYRPGQKGTMNFTIIRDKIPLHSVTASYILEGTDIGVISINRFSATTHEELLNAANELRNQGMKRLILDLRGNPGGYLNQAFLMADEFLPGQGDTIVYTLGRMEDANEVYRSRRGNQLEDIPLIVLIDYGSASASEIVSGAIQDLDRGLIVGTTSFGKGLVQRQYPLQDGSAFRLTIARYYTPSGRSIQRPYKDKDKYFKRFMERFELEEGLNLDHTIEKMKAEKGKDKIELDSIPLFKTRAGRTVLGGGGITPDYIVKSDTITKLSAQIRSKNLYNEFINTRYNSGKELRAKYENNFSAFYKEFSVSNDDLKAFRKFVESKEITWDEKDFETDKEYIKTVIKALLANIIFDRSKQALVFSDIDRQLQVAKTLFPEAEKIARMGQNKGKKK
ncbi:MAG TPA: S41 family peptidase [Candidatus Kapabacteria bacterium]|mgnify:CR=1 FL=1|jgi:carboxyl-terminal processing protease|nr:S41 family peptidase [Candidatus Kapabacteria bacterium]HPP40496.1 S41 family peptidase [Candidatus Kapabacteria bacterium]